MQRIAIVEPNHSHEEVLYPWIELLYGHYEVHVVAPQSLLDVDLLRETTACYHPVPYIERLPQTRTGRICGVFKKYSTIRGAIKRINPEVIIFNSVPTLLDAVLVALWFKNLRKIQVIHNFQMFLLPGAHFLYQAFDANLVISEQVFRYIAEHHPKYDKLDYVLPIYFDGFMASGGPHDAEVLSNAGCLNLGVFGAIEAERRNYRGLLTAIEKTVTGASQPRFRVHLVGKAPLWLQDEVRNHQLDNVVELYPEFVPFRKMFEIIKKMELVMFLIDDSVSNAKHYNRYKITGTSTLVKAFNKCGASSTDFPVEDSLVQRCLFYNGMDIQYLLNRINDGRINHNTVSDKLADGGNVKEFSFERQQTKLLAAIQRVMDRT